MPLPNVPYYAWQIHASFENNIKLPPDLKKHTNPYGQLKLLGKDVAPRTVEPLLTLVLQKKVRLLYISPFAPAGEDESLQRELNNQLLCETYTHGCGVMGFNREKSIACLRRLDASSLNLRRTKAAGDAPLPCPPVVFDSYQDMAEAAKNIILTGSIDGSRGLPPTASDTRRGVDPGLLYWIENVLRTIPETPEDLAKVTGLVANYYLPAYPVFPDWLAPEPGNWSLLGELPNLKVLFMPKVKPDSLDFLLNCPSLERLGLAQTELSNPDVLKNLPRVTYLDLPPADFDDFSFLLGCRSLEILDLSRTNFRDCSILTWMPELKRVLLPAQRQLLRRELLDPLPIQVKPNPKRVRGKDVPLYELIPPRPTEPLDTRPPYKVLHIEGGGLSCEGRGITEKVVRDLIKDIQKGEAADELYLSLEYWGEDENMILAMGEDGIELCFEDQEQPVFYALYDPETPCDSAKNDPYRRPATKNRQLAADCAAYFINTGELYPGAYWAKYYK